MSVIKNNQMLTILRNEDLKILEKEVALLDCTHTPIGLYQVGQDANHHSRSIYRKVAALCRYGYSDLSLNRNAYLENKSV